MKSDISRPTPRLGAALLLIAVVAALLATGCVPLMLGGAAVGTAMVVGDRRTSGAQLEDEGIELRATNRIRDALGDSAHVSVTSYNRLVLLTGEVASAQDKQRLGELVSKVDNVRSVVNEAAVDVPSSLGQRSSDTLITGRVKAALVDTRNVQARAFKVVTERGVVYLMGIVTQREADIASEVARNVSGVQKVVRVFEIVTEAELARAQQNPGAPVATPPPPPPPSAPAPAPVTTSPVTTTPVQSAPVQTMPVR